MTSQGQRFRRRALRRGYKVDEVDAFLDRVESTLAGEPLDAPVSAQEVHDVVFRVRFGGYDEWQVDLHLDRVERQLAEGRPAGPAFGRPPEPPDRMGPPDHLGLPERMGPPDRMGLPVAVGHVPGPGQVPGAGLGPGAGPGPQQDSGLVPHQGGQGLGPPPGQVPPRPPLPMRQVPAAGPPGYQEPGPEYGPYDEPTYGGYGGHHPARRDDRAPQLSDMTSEMRFGDPGGPSMAPASGMPESGMPDPGRGLAGQRGPASYPPPGSPPPPPPPMSGYSAAHLGGGYEAAGSGDLQRLDELRRTFQPRRFGSGYDRAQVDRLFEEVMSGMSGHGPMSVTDAQLDPRRFDLVPGGYFEGEVEAALHELRDILRRH